MNRFPFCDLRSAFSVLRPTCSLLLAAIVQRSAFSGRERWETVANEQGWSRMAFDKQNAVRQAEQAHACHGAFGRWGWAEAQTLTATSRHVPEEKQHVSERRGQQCSQHIFLLRARTPHKPGARMIRNQLRFPEASGGSNITCQYRSRPPLPFATTTALPMSCLGSDACGFLRDP